MSATLLLDAVMTHIRSLFTKQQVSEVIEYGGEFNAAEIGGVSFGCPAILVSVLGWTAAADSRRLLNQPNTRMNQCVAFVVTKSGAREQRMRQAADIADALCYGLRIWNPQDHELCAIGSLEDDPTAENLFGRAVDAKGLALWVVSWEQATRPLITPAQMFDLIAVDITSTAVHQVDDSITEPAPLVVTEEIDFKHQPN